jgi:hypothetical protein
MPSPAETRLALNVIASDAVATSRDLFLSLDGNPTTIRYQLLESVPGVIGYYADGTAALAVDFYADQRAAARIARPYSPSPVVPDRVVKIRRAIAWASEPLLLDDRKTAMDRLAEVVQPEVANPFRDTVRSNRRADSEAIGWTRVTHGGCPMCRMLAANGAVYSKTTANFATHPHCSCTIAPVFRGSEVGPEASVMQYTASRRNRTPKQQAALRELLKGYEDD